MEYNGKVDKAGIFYSSATTRVSIAPCTYPQGSYVSVTHVALCEYPPILLYNIHV